MIKRSTVIVVVIIAVAAVIDTQPKVEGLQPPRASIRLNPSSQARTSEVDFTKIAQDAIGDILAREEAKFQPKPQVTPQTNKPPSPVANASVRSSHKQYLILLFTCIACVVCQTQHNTQAHDRHSASRKSHNSVVDIHAIRDHDPDEVIEWLHPAIHEVRALEFMNTMT